MTGETPGRIRQLEEQARLDDQADRMASEDDAMPRSFARIGESQAGHDPKFEGLPNRKKMNDALAYLDFDRRMRASCVSVSDTTFMKDLAVKLCSRAEKIAESPIEIAIIPWLVLYSFAGGTPAPNDVQLPDEDLNAGDGIAIIPQLKIGRYRLDFAIVATKGGLSRIVALECDGQEFHDSLKDFARDRYLGALGIKVVRATGREITEYPKQVIKRIDVLVSEWMHTP